MQGFPYETLAAGLLQHFPQAEPAHFRYFSAPGRTELLGNHTDHQQGLVLAAAVNLACEAVAAPNALARLRVQSEGWPLVEVDLADLQPHPAEQEQTVALVRGVAAGLVDQGYAPQTGLDIYLQSSVLPGSGLSSSAAFEVLLGLVLRSFWADEGLSNGMLAVIGQKAENRYFGKPCGLMDQMASAMGGVIFVDFADKACPLVQTLSLDLDAYDEGYALCIIDVGASHADLTADYAAIPAEMGAIAQALGGQVLRDIPEAHFRKALPQLRPTFGDRAILRALHFYAENARVLRAVKALRQGDIAAYFATVRESGLSSWRLLQNIAPTGAVHHQEIAYALALVEDLLKGRGACRVHGGGFAGTIQAYVPKSLCPKFVAQLETLLRPGCCHLLALRPEPAMACIPPEA